MATDEFEDQAEQIGPQIRGLDEERRIAAACRGSANPVALAWIAEALAFDGTTSVVDLGAGLGGPLAWFRQRYGCTGLALEPSAAAVATAASVFGLAVVRASAEAVPLRDAAFDVALLLGVVSVVDDATAALREARRVGGHLGLLDYCSTSSRTVVAGGSRFPTADRLAELLAGTGWHIEQMEHVAVSAPLRWREAHDDIDVEPDPSEAEVIAAIEAGDLAPHMVAAR